MPEVRRLDSLLSIRGPVERTVCVSSYTGIRCEPEVYVATIEKVGMPFSRVQLDSLHIDDLIGALRRAKRNC